MTGKPDDQQVVLIEKQAVDWRTAPGVDDGLDLTDLQRQPWKIAVLDGAYGGLDIIATAPDGTRRQVFLEIKDGNLHVAVGGEADNLHAIVQIGAAATVVTPLQASYGALADRNARFDENGFSLHEGDIEPGCATTPPAP